MDIQFSELIILLTMFVIFISATANAWEKSNEKRL